MTDRRSYSSSAEVDLGRLYMDQIHAAHDRRVSELLQHNNDLLEQARGARAVIRQIRYQLEDEIVQASTRSLTHEERAGYVTALRRARLTLNCAAEEGQASC